MINSNTSKYDNNPPATSSQPSQKSYVPRYHGVNLFILFMLVHLLPKEFINVIYQFLLLHPILIQSILLRKNEHPFQFTYYNVNPIFSFFNNTKRMHTGLHGQLMDCIHLHKFIMPKTCSNFYMIFSKRTLYIPSHNLPTILANQSLF